MAVYTEVSDEALEAFLAEYAIGDLIAFRGIAEGVENSNFSLRTTGGDYILTLYEKRVDPADLPWFLGLMRHLAARRVSCPQPVAGRDGESLRALCGRKAAITTFLPGVWPRRVQAAHCERLGTSLAALHRAGADFAPIRANGLGPAAWPGLLARISPAADQLHPGMLAETALAVRACLDGWPDALPRGQIHADLFPDNVFFLGGEISGLIDFYFACTDFLAYDLAVCLNAWCFETDMSLNVTKSRALLRAYDRARPLDPGEWAALPLLCQGAALRFLLTRLFDWQNTPPGALVTPKNPLAYLHRLRFHRAATTASAYGV